MVIEGDGRGEGGSHFFIDGEGRRSKALANCHLPPAAADDADDGMGVWYLFYGLGT